VHQGTWRAPRITIRGETGQTQMIKVLSVDAASMIRLLEKIKALCPLLALIHVFLENAPYHRAKLVREWVARPGRRIKLHLIPSPHQVRGGLCCPHLNPIERLWAVAHKHVKHNKCYATCGQFADARLDFLRRGVPKNWRRVRDSVTDNFRVINPKNFRVLT
jgi:transposase